MKYLLSLSLFVATAAYALPPPVPSAGIIEREIEKEYEGEPLQPDKVIPPLQIDIPEKRLEMGSKKKVLITRLQIVGNSSISEAAIIEHVSGYLDQEQSLESIYEMCSKIDQLYAEKGYILARAYPPAQEIRGGSLKIEIIEGRLGTIHVVGNRYYTEQFIRSYFDGLYDCSFQQAQFLRALLLLNENKDLSVGALFSKGKEFGCTDVTLRVDDHRPIHLYLNGNNYGRDLTTNVRAGGRFDWGNALTQGDTFSVAEVVGFPVDALYFTDVIYRFPLNRRGSDLEFAYLFSKFKVEEMTSLHPKGSSAIGTVKFSQAFTRTRTVSLDFFTYFDYKQIKNFTLGQLTSFDKLRVVTLGCLLDHFQPMVGRDYLTVQFGAGIPNLLGGLKAVDARSSRQGGGGRFFVLTADYDRIQHLPASSFLYFHASGQFSPNKLTVPEQIYIGGVDTVRGFPLAVGVGDSGYYFNLEFRTPPPWLAEKRFLWSKKSCKDVVQLDLFLDHGGVFLRSIENLFLWGAGLGVRLNGSYGLSFSIDVGFPLNHRDLTTGAFAYIKLTGQPF